MDLVELRARSMDLVDLEFSELGCLAGKNWSGAIFLNLELLGALPNTPSITQYVLFKVLVFFRHCNYTSICIS
jgi:hypothetical protein